MKDMIKVFLFSAVSVAALVACNKKGDSAPVQPPPVVQNCVPGQVQANGMICVNGQLIPGGAAGGNLLNQVQFQESSGVFSGVMSISGQNMTGLNGTVDLSDPRAFTRYYGQITVSGNLTITTPICYGSVPPGSYTLQGTGSMNAGILSNVMITLSGPTMVQWNIGSGEIYGSNGYPELNGSGNRLQVGFSSMTSSVGNTGGTSCAGGTY
jgi:hypothetical protein